MHAATPWAFRNMRDAGLHCLRQSYPPFTGGSPGGGPEFAGIPELAGILAVAVRAPRDGIEPSSLILIQSQAGPASRPTGEWPATTGLPQG